VSRVRALLLVACSYGVPPDFFQSSEAPRREWVLTQTVQLDPVDIGAKLPDPRLWLSELDDLPDGEGKYQLISLVVKCPLSPRAPSSHKIVAINSAARDPLRLSNPQADSCR
jgi:hypothetical protein